MAKKLQTLKVGDFCSIFWDDASSPGRTFIPDEDLPMAELVSHGVVRHISDRRVFIRQEEDLSADAGKNGHEMKEGVLIPTGCVTKVAVFKFSHFAELP